MVLARREYNHTLSTASDMTFINPLSPTPPTVQRSGKELKRQKSMVQVVKKTVDKLARKCSSYSAGDELWVCVNVSHKVTQCVCAIDLEP